jgi:hypothetical protein
LLFLTLPLILGAGIALVVQRVRSHPSPWLPQRVEVYNATRVQYLARKVSLFLRRKGLDVLYYGNFPGSSRFKADHDKTLIVDYHDRKARHAQALRDWLGCGKVIQHYDPYAVVDVGIVLGSDYERCFPGVDTITILY